MKFCAFCGSEIEDGVCYCPQCGAVCQETAPQYPPQPFEAPYGGIAYSAAPVQQGYAAPKSEKKKKQPKQPKPRRKGKAIAIVILVLVLALAATVGVLYLRWYFSPEQRILRALDSEDYEAVSDIMQEDDFDGTSEVLIQRLTQRISDLKANYTTDTVSYEVAKMELDTVRELDISELEDELEEAEDFIELLNTSRTHFATAESFFKTEDYVEAIASYKLVVEEDPNYSLAVEQLDKSAELYRTQVLKKAEEYAKQELYSSAIASLKAGLQTLPGDSKIQEQIRIYEKEAETKRQNDALKKAKRFADEGDYTSAIDSLADMITDQTAGAELIKSYNDYCDKYKEEIIVKAEKYINNKDYTEAIAVLKQGLRILPNNEELCNKLDETNNKKPVYLDTLPISASDRYTQNQGDSFIGLLGSKHGKVDMYGHSLDRGLEAWIARWNFASELSWTWAEYELDGKYAFLTGKVTVLGDSYNIDSFDVTIEIIGDGKVLLSERLLPHQEVEDINVDISNIDTLRIYLYDNVASAGGTAFALWDFLLETE